MTESENGMRKRTVARLTQALQCPPATVALCHSKKVDAQGIEQDFWLIAHQGVITATGKGQDDFVSACKAQSIDPDDSATVTDAQGRLLTPGYIDLHAHGSWGCAFDDGPEAIDWARTDHALHGTTRQVLSLMTNPMDTMCENLRHVHEAMGRRPDVLGAHLEGPFLNVSRKGAHDSASLHNPEPGLVDRLLEAADGCLRQITLAPELPGGLEAIRRFVAAGVVPAVGHSDADYQTAKQAFNAGAGILTHIFNAMNGIHHRRPGPIPAAVENPRVAIELINDGFHVQDPVVNLTFQYAAHRIVLVTDAMSATGCPDGDYMLGALAVSVKDGHARLMSNDAIAGSTLLLETAVGRAVLDLGIAPASAVEAATLTAAKALGFDKPNTVTGAPLGLLMPGFAADFLLTDPLTWKVQKVWCAGRPLS